MEFIGNNVLIRYPGGAIYLARLERETACHLHLSGALWVADTGQLGLLVAGTPDDNCTWQPLGSLTRVPQAHAEVSLWDHELPTEAR